MPTQVSRIWLLIACFCVATVFAQDSDEFLKMHLVPLARGISEDTRGTEPEILASGRKAGLDLRHPEHPLIAFSYRNRRIFYVFFKVVETAAMPKKYLIQRIHKVERTYSSKHDPHPTIKETYLVEAFKLKKGKMKKADQHDGTFFLGDHFRREILKEYEIGFAEVPGVAEGVEWPFDPNYLYHEIHGYEPGRATYQSVVFSRSIEWSLAVAFDRDGNYSVRSPEFGFDAPDVLPPLPALEP